jgi:hypothetical protein
MSEIILNEYVGKLKCIYCRKIINTKYCIKFGLGTNSKVSSHLSCMYDALIKFLVRHEKNSFPILRSKLQNFDKYKKEMMLERLE